MNIKEALFKHLSLSSPIAALVGDRIYPVALPQNPQYPCIVYRRTPPISRENSTRGYSGMTASLFEITAWAADTESISGYDSAGAVGAALWNRLHGFKGLMGGAGGVQVAVCLATDDGSDEFDDDLQIFGDRQVYRLVHPETTPNLA